VNDRLCESWDIDASDIEVRVNQGEVTLSGTVASRREKRVAEAIADSVSGVRDVHNDLGVRAVSPRDAGRPRAA
jgi:osmotically-inducible protein OsmY